MFLLSGSFKGTAAGVWWTNESWSCSQCSILWASTTARAEGHIPFGSFCCQVHGYLQEISGGRNCWHFLRTFLLGLNFYFLLSSFFFLMSCPWKNSFQYFTVTSLYLDPLFPSIYLSIYLSIYIYILFFYFFYVEKRIVSHFSSAQFLLRLIFLVNFHFLNQLQIIRRRSQDAHKKNNTPLL